MSKLEGREGGSEGGREEKMNSCICLPSGSVWTDFCTSFEILNHSLPPSLPPSFPQPQAHCPGEASGRQGQPCHGQDDPRHQVGREGGREGGRD